MMMILMLNARITCHIRDGQINTSRHVPVILDHFNTSAGLEHDDHVTLVQRLRRGIHRDTCVQ